MKKIGYILILTLFHLYAYGQISDFKEKFTLPNTVNETSGLLFLGDKIITHNDSGDNPNLYELDSLSGNITRTITINNATNVDWEDITQDNNHIYIADFGNNLGNRNDLKIYKIKKDDFTSSNSITAEIISFNYEDQTDFTASNTHNFDAEALISYKNHLLIFTKNRGNLETNVYQIPKTAGNYTAAKTSNFDVNGLITGGTYNAIDDSFMLTGYNTSLEPFLVYIDKNRAPGNAIFNNGAEIIDISLLTGQGSQVEGITNFKDDKYYISREEVISNSFTFSPKLYQFTSLFFELLSVYDKELSSKTTIYPTPSYTSVTIKIPNEEIIKKIKLYNPLGEEIIIKMIDTNIIDTSEISAGHYYLKIDLKSKKSIIKKIIKL